MNFNDEKIIKLTKILIFLCALLGIFPLIFFIPQVRELKNNFAGQHIATFSILFYSILFYNLLFTIKCSIQ